MAEPITIAAITGLVTLMTAYMTYRRDLAKGAADGSPVPTQTGDVQQGELVAQVVEPGITTYGTDDEKADLTAFVRNPDRYANQIAQVLSDLASRTPAFAQDLQHVAAQTNSVQTGGVTGTSTVHGDNLGQSFGVVSGGTIIQTNTSDRRR